jgi:hypothetical protein
VTAWSRGKPTPGTFGFDGRLGSVAPVRHADKLPLAQHVVLSSIEIVNVNNRERWTQLVLAAERRRLHLITGHSE